MWIIRMHWIWTRTYSLELNRTFHRERIVWCGFYILNHARDFFRALACLTVLGFDRLCSVIHEKTFHITNRTIQLNYYWPKMAGESEYDEDKNVSQPDLYHICTYYKRKGRKLQFSVDCIDNWLHISSSTSGSSCANADKMLVFVFYKQVDTGKCEMEVCCSLSFIGETRKNCTRKLTLTNWSTDTAEQ